MKILAGTGHRPNDGLGGYLIPNPIYTYVYQQTEKILLQEEPDKIISGMALGFDTIIAQLAIKLNIPFVAAVPFKGQECKWPQASQDIYHDLIKQASEVVVVCDGGYSVQKMQWRNEFMVNECNKLLACWKQSKQYGGTYNCIQYARSINKEIIIIDPDNFKV